MYECACKLILYTSFFVEKMFAFLNQCAQLTIKPDIEVDRLGWEVGKLEGLKQGEVLHSAVIHGLRLD